MVFEMGNAFPVAQNILLLTIDLHRFKLVKINAIFKKDNLKKLIPFQLESPGHQL
jgi:hypothetical protein